MTNEDEDRPLRDLRASAGGVTQWATDLAAAPALTAILGDAVREMPGADGGWIAVMRDGAVDCPAVDHPQADALVRGWRECGEGPCVDAMRTRRTTTILLDDVEAEATARWPRYAATAKRIGAHSLLTFVMAPPGAAPGAVSFYAGRPGSLTELSLAVGRVFAMQAAVALYGGAPVGRLLATMEARDVVGQATGILMERFGLDDQQAYAMLVSSAQDSATPLIEIATWLTEQGKPRAD